MPEITFDDFCDQTIVKDKNREMYTFKYACKCGEWLTARCASKEVILDIAAECHERHYLHGGFCSQKEAKKIKAAKDNR